MYPNIASASPTLPFAYPLYPPPPSPPPSPPPPPLGTEVDNNEQARCGSAGTKMDKDCFFRDGKRQIDFILCWEEKQRKNGGVIASVDNDSSSNEKAKLRETFLSNLKSLTVEIEEELGSNDKKITHFIKLHIPFNLRCQIAEDLSLNVPLEVFPDDQENWSEKLFNLFRIRNFLHQEIPCQPKDYSTCMFRKSKFKRFLGSDNHDTFFTNTQRHQMASHILSNPAYCDPVNAEFGIDRLIADEVFSGAYPLHEGNYELNEDNPWGFNDLNMRQILYSYWAQYKLWYKYQPINHIKQYFGESIGYYFAWLGMYTAWLLPASIVGIIVFIYGLATINLNTPGVEACDSNLTFKMCPICNEEIGCAYWYLSDKCAYIKISYLFDHPGTVFFAVFMSLWSVVFLEFWKRTSMSLSYRWHTIDLMQDLERPRPEFAARCPIHKKNPVTGIVEPYFPSSKRLSRRITAMAVVFLMIILVIIFIVAIIVYRLLISVPIYTSKDPLLKSQTTTVANVSGATAQLVIIMILSRFYNSLAYKLTCWEMHRTESEFQEQYTMKVFIFQFVNYYSSIFYVGFVKGKFIGRPGNYTKFFGLRNEDCSHGGCFIELAQQLAVIMIGQQIINNFWEIGLPKLTTLYHQFSIGVLSCKTEKLEEMSRWERDYCLIPYDGLFYEYLEMVLQFGFITIFVAAFPLAPFFALLNNWLEIRLDAKKLVCKTRRPVYERANDIGIWFSFLNIIAKMSVISNAFLIAFTSDFLAHQVYKYNHDWHLKGYTKFSLAWSPDNSTKEPCRYKAFRDDSGEFTEFHWKLLVARLSFFILFELIVNQISGIIDFLIPDVPEELQNRLNRQCYLSKKALADSGFDTKLDNEIYVCSSDRSSNSNG